MRLWVDNTGEFKVEGKLTIIMPDKVRLLKPTGRTTTVPMSRLSKADLDYVQQIAAQYGNGEIVQLAVR